MANLKQQIYEEIASLMISFMVPSHFLSHPGSQINSPLLNIQQEHCADCEYESFPKRKVIFLNMIFHVC